MINGISFTAQLDVDAAGKATVTYTIPSPAVAEIPIAVHSYTDINLGPKQFVTGTIPIDATTATLVVPRIECGQLDIKAVFTAPGDSNGNIAGPVVTWGDVCQTVPTTATTAPTTVSPSACRRPASRRPTSSRPSPAPGPPASCRGRGRCRPWRWPPS